MCEKTSQCRPWSFSELTDSSYFTNTSSNLDFNKPSSTWLKIHRKGFRIQSFLPQYHPVYWSRVPEQPTRLNRPRSSNIGDRLPKKPVSEMPTRDVFTSRVCSVAVGEIFGDVEYLKGKLGLCLPTEAEILQNKPKVMDIKEAQNSYKWHRIGQRMLRTTHANRMPQKKRLLLGKRPTWTDNPSSDSLSIHSNDADRESFEKRLSANQSALRQRQFELITRDQMRQLAVKLHRLRQDVNRSENEECLLKIRFYKATGMQLDEMTDMMSEKDSTSEKGYRSERVTRQKFAGRRITQAELFQFLDERGDKDLAMARDIRKNLRVRK